MILIIMDTLKEKDDDAIANLCAVSNCALVNAKWVLQMFEHLNTRRDLIFHGFESAAITEAVEKCNEISNPEENQFGDL